MPAGYETMPFVQSGYRVGYDSCGCLTSVFEVHNETINIWTHWLGALWFAYLIRVDSSTATWDASTILIFRLICLNLFASSAGYHTFGAISPRAMRLWLRADKLGISLMIAGSYIPGIWLGFRCRPRARLVWMAQALVLLIVGAMLALECFPKRHSAKAFASLAVHKSNRTRRVSQHPTHWLICAQVAGGHRAPADGGLRYARHLRRNPAVRAEAHVDVLLLWTRLLLLLDEVAGGAVAGAVLYRGRVAPALAPLCFSGRARVAC